MADPTLLRSLGFILVAAAIVVVISGRLKIPSIVAYILTGLVLGPLTGLLAVNEAIHLIAEVGIALLLFLVGLELSLDKIKDVGRVAAVGGAVQMGVTAAAGYGISRMLGFSNMDAIFIAVAVTFSSTVVVVKLLEQRKELHSLYGRIAVGILLMQDLAVIVVLTFLAGMGSDAAISVSDLFGALGSAFVGMGVLMAAAVVAARYALPRIFGWMSPSSEGLFVWSLCWCFLFIFTAELLHLSPEIGAFLAGVALAQLPYNHDLRRRVHPLTNFFLAIFFVSLGIQMELSAAVEQLPAALIISGAVLLGKPLLFMWLLGRGGYGRHTAFLTGITLAQISEFSFIATAAGVQAGLVDDALLSLVGLIGLTTIAVSAFLIRYNRVVYARADQWGIPGIFNAEAEGEHSEDGGLQDHLIVVGMNALGLRIVHELLRRGEPVVAIDTDPRKLDALPCPTVVGNAEYFSVLEEAGIAEAKLVISALQIEDANNLIAYWCRREGVPASIHAFDRSVVDELRKIGISHLMLSKNTGIKRIAAELRKEGILDG